MTRVAAARSTRIMAGVWAVQLRLTESTSYIRWHACAEQHLAFRGWMEIGVRRG